MNNESQVINLSEFELFSLLSHVSPSTVIGFQNPVSGRSTEDVFPLIQEATFSLVDKDLITFNSDNQIKIEGRLECFIRTISDPQHTILVAFRQNGSKENIIRSFHFCSPLAISLARIDDITYALEEIKEKDEIISYALQPFNSKMFWAPGTEPLYFSQASVTAMQQALENNAMEEAQKHLASAEGDEQARTHLWTTLQNTLINFSFITFYDRKDASRKYVDGLSIIADDRYIWVFEICDGKKSRVSASKITLKTLREKILGKIPSMK